MDTMLNSVLRREINRQRAVIPFSLRVVAERAFSAEPATTSDGSAQSQPIKTKTPPKIEENPYFDKYAEKIKKAQLAKESAEKVEQLTKEQQRVKDGLSKLESQLSTSASGHDPGPRPVAEDAARGSRKSLNDVVHIDLLSGHTADEIKEIWSHHHRTKQDCLYAVIPSSSYDRIYELATQYPVFLYPLPRADKSASGEEEAGYEFFLGQFRDHAFYFTSLIIYQRYKDLAPPCLVLQHFPELGAKKGIVLMNGEFDKNSINMLEAQCLANQVKLFYNGEDLRKKMLLHAFNKDPSVFKYSDLISEFEQSLIPPNTS